MKVKVIYEDKKDRELFELVEFTTPFFLEYIDCNTSKGLKESYRIKNTYGARKNPFVLITDDEDNFVGCFWSEDQNAVQSFINVYASKNKETT